MVLGDTQKGIASACCYSQGARRTWVEIKLVNSHRHCVDLETSSNFLRSGFGAYDRSAGLRDLNGRFQQKVTLISKTLNVLSWVIFRAEALSGARVNADTVREQSAHEMLAASPRVLCVVRDRAKLQPARETEAIWTGLSRLM